MSLTAEQLSAAIDLAGYPEELLDQHGRYWSKWQMVTPGKFRRCRKCGKKITSGYVLTSNATHSVRLGSAICAQHVKTRWV